MQATKAELFARLEEIYPNVTPSRGVGSGYRSWEGRLYFVGWDEEAGG